MWARGCFAAGHAAPERPSSLAAGVLESIIAAIYLDGGFEAARTFILRHMDAYIPPSPRPRISRITRACCSNMPRRLSRPPRFMNCWMKKARITPSALMQKARRDRAAGVWQHWGPAKKPAGTAGGTKRGWRSWGSAQRAKSRCRRKWRPAAPLGVRIRAWSHRCPWRPIPSVRARSLTKEPAKKSFRARGDRMSNAPIGVFDSGLGGFDRGQGDPHAPAARIDRLFWRYRAASFGMDQKPRQRYIVLRDNVCNF